MQQIGGAHAGLDELNETSIGICVIGDFSSGAPPSAQFEGLIDLLHALQWSLKIGRDAVKLHREVRSTACPGFHFPDEEVKRRLYKEDLTRERADFESEESKRASTILRMKELAGIVEDYMASYNCTPEASGPSDLLLLADSIGPPEEWLVKDAWGSKFSYVRPTGEPCFGYAIVSAGKDGVAGTWTFGDQLSGENSADDVVFSNGRVFQ